MLFAIWRFIQLWLPYWLIIAIYKSNKALPVNIKMRNGRNLKAIMINNNNGIIFSTEAYIKNRTKKLREKQLLINAANEDLMRELNNLSFDAKQALIEEDIDNEVSND